MTYFLLTAAKKCVNSISFAMYSFFSSLPLWACIVVNSSILEILLKSKFKSDSSFVFTAFLNLVGFCDAIICLRMRMFSVSAHLRVRGNLF